MNNPIKIKASHDLLDAMTFYEQVLKAAIAETENNLAMMNSQLGPLTRSLNAESDSFITNLVTGAGSPIEPDEQDKPTGE